MNYLTPYMHAMLHAYESPRFVVDNLSYSFHDGVCIIPGTNELEDWISNFDYEQESLPGKVRVHSGYLTLALKYSHQTPRAFFGHSLGGAVAQILGVMHNVPSVTIGAPRAGNKAFAQRSAEIGHVRIVRRGDKVPHTIKRYMPVKWFKFIPYWWARYSHGGYKIKVGKRPKWWDHFDDTYHTVNDYMLNTVHLTKDNIHGYL